MSAVFFMFTAFPFSACRGFGGLFFICKILYELVIAYRSQYVSKEKNHRLHSVIDWCILYVCWATFVHNPPSKGQAEMSAFYLKKTSIPSGETWTESRTFRHSVRLFSRVRLSYIERQPLFINCLR